MATGQPQPSPEGGAEAPPLAVLQRQDGQWVVPATLMAARFGIDEPTLRADMRAGRVTCLVERGEGADAGRSRLTVRRGAAAWALRVEADGRAWETEPAPPEPALFRMIAALRRG